MKDPSIVYAWLAEVDGSNAGNVVFQSYAKQAQDALKTNQLIRARPVFQNLKKFTETIADPLLFFEGRLILALAAHQMMKYSQALTFLEQAIHKINGYQPHSAIARWMQGCSYFASHQAAEGVSAWYASFNDFQLIALEPRYLPLERVRLLKEQMRIALETELNNLGPMPTGFASAAVQPNPPPEPGSQPEVRPPTRPPKPTPRPARRPQARNLVLSTGFDQIQAGEPVPLGLDAESYNSLEIEQFLINNQRYSIHTPPGSSTPPEARMNGLFILRVKGDSMNQAGIRDGDYVLLRLQQHAANGEIVAAEITGDEYEATLKRYLVFESGKRVILQPESDNPQHKAREFLNGKNGQGNYRILGVVVAILKQM